MAKKSPHKRPTAKSKATPSPKSKAAKPVKKAARTTAPPKPAIRAKKASKPAPAVEPKTVESYVTAINDWRKEAVGHLRDIIRKAAPKAEEKAQDDRHHYEHQGPLAWIKSHARHVKLGFWRGVELPDPRKVLEGTGKKLRHIKIKNLKQAGEKRLEEFVRVAAELNEIKGKKK